MNKPFYLKASVDKISSPEKLDAYIRVVSPGYALIACASLFLLGALFVWGFFGVMETTQEAAAYRAQDGSLICYVDATLAGGIEPGTPVKSAGLSGSVADVAGRPVSFADAVIAVGDAFTADQIGLAPWNTRLTLTMDSPPPGDIVPVTLITRQTRPIDFLLGRAQGAGL